MSPMRVSCWPLIVPLALLAALSLPHVSRAQAAGSSPARAIESEVLAHLAGGRQAAAERMLADALTTFGDDQALVFLRACCERSRFDLDAARPLLRKVVELDPGSVAGLCATEVLALDGGRDGSAHFGALEDLVRAHPDDALLRWMIAVQCRSFDRNEEGIAHYRRLLELWQPGPVLVHQTYANLLSELDRHEEALVERRLAVEMEPASWSYEGLGNTLSALARYEEASEAYRQTVERDPQDRSAWRNLAWTLMKCGRDEEALPPSERAAQLDPERNSIWRTWAFCLERLDRKREALRNYREAVRLDPKDSFSRDKEAALMEAMPGVPPVALLPAGYVDYGRHDLTRLLGTRTDGQGNESHFLDARVVSAVMDDLSQHAKILPVTFRSEPERRRAERDVSLMASVIEIAAAGDDADPELLLVMGRLHAIGHNLDIDGAAERSTEAFRRLLAREPEHAMGNYHLGVLLASSLDPEDDTAFPYLEKALALGVHDANYALGMKYLVREAVDEALPYLKAYASKRPEDEMVRQLIDSIETDTLNLERNGAGGPAVK